MTLYNIIKFTATFKSEDDVSEITGGEQSTDKGDIYLNIDKIVSFNPSTYPGVTTVWLDNGMSWMIEVDAIDLHRMISAL